MRVSCQVVPILLRAVLELPAPARSRRCGRPGGCKGEPSVGKQLLLHSPPWRSSCLTSPLFPHAQLSSWGDETYGVQDSMAEKEWMLSEKWKYEMLPHPCLSKRLLQGDDRPSFACEVKLMPRLRKVGLQVRMMVFENVEGAPCQGVPLGSLRHRLKSEGPTHAGR